MSGAIRALLLDADGNLFPSEEPAFAASTVVVNRMMEGIGCARRFEPEPLRLATLGKNFRTTAAQLAADAGKPLGRAELEYWVGEEKAAVTAHLAEVLRPDRSVTDAVAQLGERFTLAAVSSSALSRLDACFRATGLAELIPPERRFSAEDSLPEPRSKPDPAVYRHAVTRLGIEPDEALAIEDSATGARSALDADVSTVGNLAFVAQAERAARMEELVAEGVDAVVASWDELVWLLQRAGRRGRSSGRHSVTGAAGSTTL